MLDVSCKPLVSKDFLYTYSMYMYLYVYSEECFGKKNSIQAGNKEDCALLHNGVLVFFFFFSNKSFMCKDGAYCHIPHSLC